MRRGTLSLVVALTLALAIASNAAANRLDISNQGIRAVWTGMTFAEGTARVRCPVTLEGSFVSRTIAKQNTTEIGRITRAVMGNFVNCSERANVTTAAFLSTTLPWAIFYTSFRGALPNINTINLEIIEFAVEMTIAMVACLYRATLREPLKGAFNRNFTTGVVTGFMIEKTPAIRRKALEVCPEKITVEGTSGTVTKGGETASITIELVA